jgi:Uri superfamily endonuclease
MGNYILVLQLERPLVDLEVGRFGRFDFAPGYYFYVGSAFGSGGLAARLNHHQRQPKPRKHWHIDYLREYTALREAWTVRSQEHLECRWCKRLAATPGLTIPVPGFGSRDTHCPAHLFYSPQHPGVRTLSKIMLADLQLDRDSELLIEVYLFEG